MAAEGEVRPNPSLERRPREACHPWAAQAGRRLHYPARPKGGPLRGSPQLERYTAQNTIPSNPRPRRARLAGRVGTTAQRCHGSGRRRLVTRRPSGRAGERPTRLFEPCTICDPQATQAQVGRSPVTGSPAASPRPAAQGTREASATSSLFRGRRQTIGTAARSVQSGTLGACSPRPNCIQSGAQCQAWQAGS
jgi:hypothetical protein